MYALVVESTQRRSDRNTMVDVADELLRAQGPHGLSVRAVALQSGTSTQAVYTHFGGKAGLVEALYLRGFQLLEDALARADLPNEPLDRIRAIARVYRTVALENPEHYALMMSSPIPGFVPQAPARAYAISTMSPLVDAIDAAAGEAVLVGNARTIAHRLWAAGHGHISLEIHGLIEGNEADFGALCDRMIDAHRG